MRFKTAVRYGLDAGVRYIQRLNGNTIFDLVKYQPEHMDQEDIRSDDWTIPKQSVIRYFNKAGK